MFSIIVLLLTSAGFIYYIKSRFYINVYSILSLWSRVLQSFVDEQDEELTNLAYCHKELNAAYGKIPGLCPAEYSKIPAAKLLDRLLQRHEAEILQEIMELVNVKKYTGLPMIDLDRVQRQGLGQKAANWRPIWIRFLDTYSGVASQLPRLTGIAKAVKADIWLLHISLMTQAELKAHEGVFNGVLRYHYPIIIPESNLHLLSGTHMDYDDPKKPKLGMIIDNTYFHWSRNQGVVWNDMIKHSSWNNTDLPRLVIFADIQRQFKWSFLNTLNRLLYRLLHKTKHVKAIQERLAKEGKSTF
jgi:hypothetical protein